MVLHAVYMIQSVVSAMWLVHVLHSVVTNRQFCMSQQVFLACPSTVKFNDPQFELVKQFYPHLSMEDPPDLNSLFSPAQVKSVTCSSNHQKRKYQDREFTEDSCRKESKETHTAMWRFYSWKDINRWTKSELSLNLYRYKTY